MTSRGGIWHALTTSNRRTIVGLVIFIVLSVWVLGALSILTWWGWYTYPSFDDAEALAAGIEDSDALVVLKELRSEWLSTVKDLGLTLTVTPATALLSAVIGYILRGEHDAPSDETTADSVP